MFCRKCGKPTEGEAILCPQCAAAEQVEPEITEQPAAPVEPGEDMRMNTAAPMPAEEAPGAESFAEDAPAEGFAEEVPAEAVEEEPFTLGTVETEEPRKGKGLRIALLLGGLVAVVAIAVALIFLLQKEPQEALADIQKSSLEKGAQTLGTMYEDYKKTVFKAGKENSGSHAKLELILSETVQAALSQEAGTDMSWLDSVAMDIETYSQGGKRQQSQKTLLNGTELMCTDTIRDGQYRYFRDTAMYDGYLRQADFSGADSMEDIQNMPMPEGELLADLLRRYGTIVIDNLTEVTCEDKTVALGGLEEDMTVYTAYMRAPQVLGVNKQIRDELHGDVALETWLDQVSQRINEENEKLGYTTEETDLYQELLDKMDQAVGPEVWEQRVAEAQAEPSFIKVMYYVNDDDEIVGADIHVYEKADKRISQIFLLAVTDEDLTAYEVNLNDQLQLTGQISRKEQDKSLDCTVVVDGQEILKLHLYDVYTDGQETGGKMRITLGDAVMEEMDLGAIALVSPVIELEYMSREDALRIEATISTLGNELLTLKVENSTLPGKEITVPTESEDYLEFIKGFYAGDNAEKYYQTLSKRLLEAGVPNQLVTSLYAGLTQILSMFPSL